jgi:hypothetical protein
MMEKTAKPKRVPVAGQTRHKSLRAALQSVSEIMGRLHVETVEKGKRK